jgi:hypothetical protein
MNLKNLKERIERRKRYRMNPLQAANLKERIERKSELKGRRKVMGPSPRLKSDDVFSSLSMIARSSCSSLSSQLAKLFSSLSNLARSFLQLTFGDGSLITLAHFYSKLAPQRSSLPPAARS